MNESLPETKKQSVVEYMATAEGMDPAKYYDCIMHTMMPSNSSWEDVAAFLLVAKKYGLNPLRRELYAFPNKNGRGIQVVLSIDGWLRMAQSDHDWDGTDYVDKLDEGGNVTAITCIIYRKSKSHPIKCTEYLSECQRDTQPWREYPKRMLRHKATIQAIRYAFGTGGLMDKDDYDRQFDGEIKNAEMAKAIEAQKLFDSHDPSCEEDFEA